MALLGPIQRAVSVALITHRLKEEGKEAGNIRGVFRLAHVHLVNLAANGDQDSNENNFTIAIIAGMLLYMTLVIYGMSTMRSVMEEKSTRIIEILVSSIKPFHLLTGKIVSVGAAALTQYLVWAATVGVLVGYGSHLAHLLRPGASAPRSGRRSPAGRRSRRARTCSPPPGGGRTRGRGNG